MSTSLEQTLLKMKAAYASTLGLKLHEIEEVANSWLNNSRSEESADSLVDLRSKTHSLAGSAGTYGFTELGEIARKLDIKCQNLIEKKTDATSIERREISALIEKLLLHRPTE